MKLRLGEMTLDLAARQLVRGGDEIHLSPKAFELLKYWSRTAARAREERAARAPVAGHVRIRGDSPRWSPRFGTHSAMMRESLCSSGRHIDLVTPFRDPQWKRRGSNPHEPLAGW